MNNTTIPEPPKPSAELSLKHLSDVQIETIALLEALEKSIGYALAPSNTIRANDECSVAPVMAKVVSDIGDRTVMQMRINERISDFIYRLAL